MEQSLRSALRDRTRPLHARLDTALTGPAGQLPDVPGYVRVVATLHTLHRHADGPLRAWVHTSTVARGLDPALVPDRAAAYADDLRALGVQPDLRESPQGAAVGDAGGLARLYLLAGSAAGARVLLRALPTSVPEGARRGLTSAAGTASTRLWQETCSLLSQPFDEELQKAAVDEACAVLEMLLGRQELMAS